MSLRAFVEKFDQLAESPDAVARMRELVLQMAVRGKLVPQNPGDEPAANAIQRLAALNNAGRTTKSSSKADSIEAPFQIPASWKWVRFGDLVRIRTGKLDANAAVEGGEYPFFTCSKTPSRISSYSFDTSAVILAGNGDFNLKSYSGKFDAYQRTYVIEPLGWELGFCFWLVSAQIKRITDSQRGSAIPYLRLGDISEPHVPFPPLAEQKRIVAKVDELMALCDRLALQQQERETRHAALARASLARFADAPTPANLSFLFHPSYTISPADFRKCIINLAVQGKLVHRNVNDKPAEGIVAHVAKVRRAEKAKEFRVITDDEAPYEVPFSWSWVRLGNISLSSDSGWSPQCMPEARSGSEWGVLKVSAVSWGAFRPEENKALPPGIASRPDCEVKAGDFLLSRANTEDLVARSVVVDQTPPRLMMSDKIVRFKFPEEIEPRYINFANSSHYARTYYARNASGTSSSMKNIGREVMCNLPIPLPPLAEQRRIVAKTDQLMALVDQLEAQLTASRATATKLLDAIVAELTAA